LLPLLLLLLLQLLHALQLLQQLLGRLDAGLLRTAGLWITGGVRLGICRLRLGRGAG
jgi:hypothetical protein